MGTRSPWTPHPISGSRVRQADGAPGCATATQTAPTAPGCQPSTCTAPGMKVQRPQCRCALVWPLPGPEAATHLSCQPGERLLPSFPVRSCSSLQGTCQPRTTGKGHKGDGEGVRHEAGHRVRTTSESTASSHPSSEPISTVRGRPAAGQAAPRWDSRPPPPSGLCPAGCSTGTPKPSATGSAGQAALVDLVKASQDLVPRRQVFPQCPGCGHGRSTCSWGHSTDVVARLCRSLPAHHQTRDSAKPGLTHLPKGVGLSLLPRGTDLTDRFKSLR